MKHWIKYYKRLCDGEKVPRKAKITVLGRKISKQKIKLMINKWKPDDSIFCPYCGCNVTKSTGNMAEYPERWVRTYCLRCQRLVEESDNSPYVHILKDMYFNK